MKDAIKNLLEDRKYRTAYIITVVAVIAIIIAIFLLFKSNKEEKAGDGNKVVAQMGYEEAYKLLTDMQSTAYEGQTIAQFDQSIEEFFKDKKCTFSQAMQSVQDGIKKNDESYDFIMTTLKASKTELDPENKQPYVITSTEVNYIDNTGGEGKLKFQSKIEYTIVDRKKMTVHDRDEKIEEYGKCIDNYANQMIMENVKEDEVRYQIEARMKEWSTRLSNDKITFKGKLEDLKIE